MIRGILYFWLSMALFASAAAATLNWGEATGYRKADLAVPKDGKPGFKALLAGQAGIHFINTLAAARVHENRILENGSGVAVADVDGDGYCDVYFCRLEGDNALYRNRRNWQFEDITKRAGVACQNQLSTGAAFADVDGDRDFDLLVNSIGNGTRLFLNDGKGRFSEATNAGLVRKFGSTSIALADIDGDADLDLYVTNYRTDTMRDSPPGLRIEMYERNGEIFAAPENRFFAKRRGKTDVQVFEKGEEDLLYLNDGKGRFTPVPWTGGTFLDNQGRPLPEPPRDWGLSAMFRDWTGDGAPDLYVCNDFNFSFDHRWVSDGRGRFHQIPPLALRNMSMSSMGVDFADINRDGHVDFVVVDMLSRSHERRHRQRVNVHPEMMVQPAGLIDNEPEVMRNTLYLNRGDGTFAEIAQLSGVDATEWSWSPVFLDVDLDGFEDLLITTGNGHDVLDSDAHVQIERLTRANPSKAVKALAMLPRLHTPNFAFRNRGDLTFEEMGRAWGFDAVGVSHGIALADFDNDGDLDLVVNNLNEAPGIYRNETSAPRLAVRLKGSSSNSHGIGATINITGGPVAQSQEIIAGGRYLSSDEPMRTFATGTANRLQIEVLWRSGKRSTISNALPNCIYEIDESAASQETPNAQHSSSTLPRLDPSPNGQQTAEPQPTDEAKSKTLFSDASGLLNHRHFDEPFDDFARQPLLPNRLSQLGPGVAWHDFDDDGWDDLIVGSGRGGRLAVLRNDTNGRFIPVSDPPVLRTVTRDQSGIVGFASTVVVGSSNYEDGQTNGGWIRIYDLKRQAAGESILGPNSSTGPLAMADADGDGDLDLFIGGRSIAGKYPEPADSLLMRNENGRFAPWKRFEKVGLVSGSVFTDLSGDGLPELVLACEWSPVRVFQMVDNDWTEQTEKLGLSFFAGWWNGVSAGDFDGDGRLDIVASNWGRNTKYEKARPHPLHVYFGDFDRNGTFDILEAYYNQGKLVPWRALESIRSAIPLVAEKFSSYAAFGRATVQDVLGQELSNAGQLQARWLDSTVFFNRGGSFEPVSLPIEAQFAPAFGVSVADFNGDGHEDVFLSQNLFATQPETSRYDAGRGLLLTGDGRGRFRIVPGQESGLKIYGEQRGCAAGDFDNDGRVDLVVAQNSAATKLFRNQGAKRGLRIRLKGPAGNPNAVGAAARLRWGDQHGPVREIHAGSGYWSQDSSELIMAAPQPPDELWVRWPGGQTTTSKIPVDALEINVDHATVR